MYVTFADDLQIYFHCPLQELNDGLACVNSDIAAVTNWACLNGMLLNANKTKAMIIGTARYINRINFAMLDPLIVDGTSIAFVNSARALGVTLNSTLTWNDHVLAVRKQIFKVLFQLKHSSDMLSQTLRAKLISNLVIPLLDYGCIVYIDVTKEQSLSLQRALNACIRFIYSARRDDHIKPFFRELKWLSPDNRRCYYLGALAYCTLTTRAPSYLYDILSYQKDKVKTITHKCVEDLFIPQCRTETFRHSF
jgi:hypothetical protein